MIRCFIVALMTNDFFGSCSIQTARRNLSIPPHSTPSSPREDLLWRHVIQEFSGRGLKRKQSSRRKSSGVARPHGSEDEDEEEEEVLSSSKKRNTRSKRPRTSTSFKKPLSRMTKAEVCRAE
jgi:hypothetical protein